MFIRIRFTGGGDATPGMNVTAEKINLRALGMMSLEVCGGFRLRRAEPICRAIRLRRRRFQQHASANCQRREDRRCCARARAPFTAMFRRHFGAAVPVLRMIRRKTLAACPRGDRVRPRECRVCRSHHGFRKGPVRDSRRLPPRMQIRDAERRPTPGKTRRDACFGPSAGNALPVCLSGRVCSCRERNG